VDGCLWTNVDGQKGPDRRTTTNVEWNSDGHRMEQQWTSDEMGTNVEQNDDETVKRDGLQL